MLFLLVCYEYHQVKVISNVLVNSLHDEKNRRLNLLTTVFNSKFSLIRKLKT